MTPKIENGIMFYRTRFRYFAPRPDNLQQILK